MPYQIHKFWVVVLLGAMIGCGGSVGGLGEPGSKISLTLDRAGIPADGVSSAAVSALITDSSGNPAARGTWVSFATNLGRFRNGRRRYRLSTMDDSGVAVASVRADTRPGTATIVVTANDVTQKINLLIGFGAVSITLSAQPPRIPADGRSSSTITATLTDSAGAPAAPGTQVRYDTNLGFFANGETTCRLSTIDDSGIVEVALISGPIAGTAEVHCASAGSSQLITVIFSDNLPAGFAQHIFLTASPDSVPADGVSTSTITARLVDGDNQPVPIGTRVTFSTTLGMFPNGSDSFTVLTSDESGAVTAFLTAASSQGRARVEAQSGEILQAVEVAFSGS